MSKKCQICNTLNDNSYRFCINCGEALEYNDIPENQPNQYQQDFNQYQNPSYSNNQTSQVEDIVKVIIILIILIIAISSISAFVLYLV